MNMRDDNMITERYMSDPEGAVLVQERSENSRKKGKSATGAKPQVKKTAPRGKAEKAAVKPKQKPQQEEPKKTDETPSLKTPSVMKLVQDTGAENQVIAAGKSRIPRQLRGIEPLSRVMRRDAENEKHREEEQSAPLITRDLTEMVISAEAPGVLARFNACDCEVCRRELARLAAAEIPARYMRLPENADISWNGFTEEERLLLAAAKKSAMSVMIRLMMGNKKRNFHG